MTLFGEALRDCYRRHQKGTFYICDDQGEYPLNLAYYMDVRLEPHEVELLKRAKGKVLEVGCGAGRVMRYLQYKGFDVTGFDFDKIMVGLCRDQGLKKVFYESTEKMEKLGAFDTIVLLTPSVGTAGCIEGLKRLLDKCYECCNTNGILVFDSLESIMGESTGKEGIIEKRLRLKYNEKYSRWFSWIHIGSEAAKNLLSETGWKIEETIRSTDRYGYICHKIERL